MSNIEFDNDGVYLRWDDRVATSALFTYVRLLHPTLSQEELEQTEDYQIVRAYCKMSEKSLDFVPQTILLDGLYEDEDGRKKLYEWFVKDPINVAVVLVQNYNNKENV